MAGENENTDLIDEGTQNQDVEPTLAKDKSQQSNEDRKPVDNELADEMRRLRETFEKGNTKKEDEPKLTPEQEAEMWAVFDPEKASPGFIKDFFNLPDDATPELIEKKKKLFATMQQGLVRQAVVGARNLHTIDFEKFKGEFQPVKEYVTRAEQRDAQRSFAEAYPALADKKYEKIVNLSAKSLKRETFKSEEEYFKALADSAAETIEAATGQKIDVGAKTTTQETKKPAGTTPRIPRTSVGSQGGTGGGSAAASKSSKGGDVDALS